MKTYSETQGETPINWWERVGRDPETVTEDEWFQWSMDAQDWVTCACGNQCDVLPRRRDGSPEDDALFMLGLQFSSDIDAECLESARETLHQIEARSAKLIAEIQSKKP